jgi:hypothetical protein
VRRKRGDQRIPPSAIRGAIAPQVPVDLTYVHAADDLL